MSDYYIISREQLEQLLQRSVYLEAMEGSFYVRNPQEILYRMYDEIDTAYLLRITNSKNTEELYDNNSCAEILNAIVTDYMKNNYNTYEEGI